MYRTEECILFLYHLDEGTKPIFDRDEIKHWIPDVPEQRVIAMVEDKPVQRNVKPARPSPPRRVNRAGSREKFGAHRSRSRSPRHHGGNMHIFDK